MESTIISIAQKKKVTLRVIKIMLLRSHRADVTESEFKTSLA